MSMSDDDRRLERITANLRTTDEVAQDAVVSLKKALDTHAASADALGNRIWWLNVWLLVVTVAIGALTFVQALAAWKVLTR